jgi:hypothetical protein
MLTTFAKLELDSVHLDALIEKLKTCGGSELLIEHLQTAHAYLHGGMPQECCHNLDLARAAVAPAHMESEVNAVIDDVLHSLHPSAAPPRRRHGKPGHALATEGPPATAKGLDAFFEGGDVSFGLFYPKKHVVAVFRSFEQAQAGQEALAGAGFRLWETIAVPPEEVLRFLDELRGHHTLWSNLMMEFSRLLDTEAGLVDSYGRWSHGSREKPGAGFLIAYSPTEADAEGIFELLRPLHPFAFHWFMAGYIRTFASA